MNKPFLFIPKALERCRCCAYRYKTTESLGGMRRVHHHRCSAAKGLILDKKSNHWKIGCTSFKEK